MSVVKIEEISGKSGSSSGPDQSSLTRIWRVYTDSPFDTPAEIQPAMPVQYGSALATNSSFLALAVSFDMEHKGPGLSVWIVTYTFKTQSVDEEKVERQQFPNPLDRRTRVSIRHVRYGKLTDRDRNGNVKRTSAGEMYPEKEVDATRYAFHFYKNMAQIPAWVGDLQDKINSAPVTIRGFNCEKGTLKFTLEDIPEKKIENGHKHFQIRWILEWRREGWQDHRVDAGFYYLDATGKLVRMKDDANPPQETVIEEYLDGTGGRLRDIIANPQPGDETVNDFDDYEEADYSVMPLTEVASGTA